MNVAAYLFARLDAALADLSSTIRIILHPRRTRRRMREMQRWAHRLRLGNRQLAMEKAALEATAITAAHTLDEASQMLGDQQDVIGRLTGRVAELEQAAVAASGEQGPPDDGWADVVAAGLGVPDTKPQCPEGLLLDEVELHRCVRDGGHEGDHWSRDHKRQWPQVEVDENIEVPW